MRKTFLSMVAVFLVISVALLGCSQRPSGATETVADSKTAKPDAAGNTASSGGGEKIKLSVYSTITATASQDVMKEIANDFMKENPNTQVEFQFPGTEYENILKVKMAANDLPDVFDTHGWAIIRYGKYLADLKDQPWASQQTDTIKPVVTDKDGKVHALVMSEAKDGISYNVDLLQKYNIELPKTFEELLAASEKIKTQSNGEVTPLFMSGIDNGMIGGFLDLYATALLISPKVNDMQALLDGKFDWNKWTPLAQKLLDMKTKGYINVDVLTAKRSDVPQRFAQGKIAFLTGAPSFADDVHKINPNVKIGLMPLTSMVSGDEPTFTGGERYTMGAWKDGKHLNESKKLIAFYAKADNMAKIANVNKLPAGLKGVKSQHEFSEYYDKYVNTRVFPYFDRVYLPNGMWDVMCKTGTALLAESVTPAQFSEKMKQEFERLRNK
ncbi:raffinose/stachyose/melibiose transport system substrate-binding protein [Paenibacillus sp. 1_12]|uniref:ABC transporter substrate-binding protein n=1 Tax=Paenibacillus sp. 1_12 TaxID=1566278 RepID=UPI0008E61ED2|nr:extracellular solute-binding protein [Paenibacillus sp. 1_12]SFM27016.1 raffinose/stachyose/melibiose transport system substrate-binding protein [Paenibacillus sp. 1_12]